MHYHNISKIAKDLIADDTFRSYYCGTVFKNYEKCFFGFCFIHNTIKFSGRCSRIFHIECTDLSMPMSLPINLQNNVESSSSCVKIYSMADETILLHTEWLCMKCKYEKVTPVTLHFNEHFLFENKCLNVRLQIVSDIKISDRKKSQDVNKFLSKLNDICPQ